MAGEAEKNAVEMESPRPDLQVQVPQTQSDDENDEALSSAPAPVNDAVLTRTRSGLLVADYETIDYDGVYNKALHDALGDHAISPSRALKAARVYMSIMTAVVTGLVVYGLFRGSHELIYFKANLVASLIETMGASSSLPYVLVGSFMVASVALASALVGIFDHNSAGSGVPDVRSVLNGNYHPDLLHMRGLYVRCVGLVLAIGASMAADIEGPSLHIGATVSAALANVFLRKTEVVSEKLRLRSFGQAYVNSVAVGAAAGMSAAFSAPLAGVLFVMEEASHWTSEVALTTFLSSAISYFAVVVTARLSQGNYTLTHVGLVALSLSSTSFESWEIFVFAIYGVLGGLICAALSKANDGIVHVRSRYLQRFRNRKRKARFLETIAVAILCTFLILSFSRGLGCQTKLDGEGDKYLIRLGCAEDEYSLAATLVLNSHEYVLQESCRKSVVSDAISKNLSTGILFSFILLCMVVLTYGTLLPTGVDMPCMMAGAVLGLALRHALGRVLSFAHPPELYGFVGACAMGGGFSRRTLRITAVFVGLANDMDVFVPAAVTVALSSLVAESLTRSFYDQEMADRRVPMLEEETPRSYMALSASDRMQKDLVTVEVRESAEKIERVLKHTTHESFPVVVRSAAGDSYRGTIARSSLLYAMKCHGAISERKAAKLSLAGLFSARHRRKSRKGEEQSSEATGDVEGGTRSALSPIAFYARAQFHSLGFEAIVTPRARSMEIDLSAYADFHAPFVTINMPLHRAYKIYRTVGLRLLPVGALSS